MDNRKIISEFLALPPESMPAADWCETYNDDMGSPWPYLRDAILPEGRQRLNHTGEKIRIHADREGWRDGVIVVV